MSGLRLLAFVSAGASAVVGGAFFGFSTFVMPALRRLPATDAVSTMQAINVTAPRGIGLPLAISGLGSAAVGAWVLARDGSGGAKALVVAGAVAGVVAFAITAAYHVPRNNRLDTVAAASAQAGPAWDDFYPGWVSMNHVRAALSLASAALVTAGAVRL